MRSGLTETSEGSSLFRVGPRDAFILMLKKLAAKRS